VGRLARLEQPTTIATASTDIIEGMLLAFP